jgi:hypothetical protein
VLIIHDVGSLRRWLALEKINYLNVSDVEVIGVKILALSLSIALGVGEKIEEMLDRLLREAAWARELVVLHKGSAASGAVEATERHAVLVINYALEVRAGLDQRHVLDGHGSLPHVLEGGAQIRSTGLGRLGHSSCLRLTGVLDHCCTSATPSVFIPPNRSKTPAPRNKALLAHQKLREKGK